MSKVVENAVLSDSEESSGEDSDFESEGDITSEESENNSQQMSDNDNESEGNNVDQDDIEEKETDDVDDTIDETEDEYNNDEEVEHIDITESENGVEIEKQKNNCLYNKIDNDEINADVLFDDDDKIYSGIIKKEGRITKPFLTKYERVRLLSVRTKQLSLGAKPMIKDFKERTPKEIAEHELSLKMIPLKIHRKMPNGETEEWKLSELEIGN